MNRRPHPYQLIKNPEIAGVQQFPGLFVPDRCGFPSYPLHCFHPLLSPCGSGCGSSTQFATCRTGLTRLNFIARSGVVSGQSSSKVMGMLLARSNSFSSSGVKANSFISSLVRSAAFAIVNTSFKIGGQPCRNQPGNLSGFSVLVNNRSIRIHYKQHRLQLNASHRKILWNFRL